ncbi:MAG: extracellular solute-binding protein [Armatimonadetes bacterium]|nr:extracellular solute-binding protein [Armatimonadota bacterium]
MAMRWLRWAGILLAAALALVTVPAGVLGQSRELVIYSGRGEPLIQPVVQAYRQRGGVNVVVRSGPAAQLANAILEEGSSPRGDVFIANDAATLEVLRLRGALQAYLSERVRQIPAALRAGDGAWVGVSGRGRVIMYNTRLLAERDVPKSIFDLADPRWRGKVAVATTRNESVVAHIAALRLLKGEDFTRSFLRRLKENQVRTLPGHTQVRQAVGKGEFPLGFVNHYYYHLERQAGSPVAVVYPDQGTSGIGAMVNVAGAGIIKGARHLSEARAFVDYLLSPTAQNLFARTNFEYPLIPGVATVAGVRPLDGFKWMPVSLDRIGAELDKTLRLIEDVGLD